MVHLIVAITGAHRAPDLPLAAAVALWPSSGCRSRSRSWMCQCHRSRRKSWRLLLVRSSATLVQASGDSTGGRAHIEQIVDVPVPRILEQHVDVIKVIPEEWMSKRIVQQIVDVPVPQIPKQIVGVALVILQEQNQRMRFFSFDSVWEGDCGRHVPHVLPHSPPPHARVDSECKRWNLEHVVLDLFSHFTLGKVQVRWLFVSCRGSCPSNSPFALSRLANLTHAVAARFVSASPLGSTTTAVCCTSLTSNSSPPEIGRAVSSQLAAIMEANSCSCASSTCALASESHRIACGTRTRGHRLSMKRRPIECALMDQSFRASSCPTLRRGGSRRTLSWT